MHALRSVVRVGYRVGIGLVIAFCAGCGSNSTLKDVAEKEAIKEFRVVMNSRDVVAVAVPSPSGEVWQAQFTATAYCKHILFWSPCGPYDPDWKPTYNAGLMQVQQVGSASPQQPFLVTVNRPAVLAAARSSTAGGGAFFDMKVKVSARAPAGYTTWQGWDRSEAAVWVEVPLPGIAPTRQDFTSSAP